MNNVVVKWPQPAAKYPQSHFLTTNPPSRMRERIGRIKVRRLVGQDNDNLVSEGKRGRKLAASKAIITYHLPQAGLYATRFQAMFTFWNTLPLLPLPVFISELENIWPEIPLCIVWVSCSGHLPFELPAFTHPHSAACREGRKEGVKNKKPWYCASIV